jgi:hypothetical protein
MDYSQIKTNINVDRLQPWDLFEPANFTSIKHLAYKLIDSLDFDGAVEFGKKLEAKLEQIEPDDKKEAYLKEILNYWVLRLKLFGLSNLTTQEADDLFKKHLLQILTNNFDVRKALLKSIDVFDTGQVVKDQVRIYLDALRNNQEILGSNEQLLKTNNFKPTLSFWIKEYQTILGTMRNAKSEPGTFHILKFLDTNQNTKLLNDDEKEILISLLDLYNWLLAPVIYADSSGQQEEQTSPYITQQRFMLPRGEVGGPERSLPKAKSAPPLAERDLPKPKLPPANLKNPLSPFAKPPPDAIRMPPPITDPKKKLEMEIDRRLEELKKRGNTNI